MTQTVKGSLTEAVTNTVAGFGINFAANWFLLPLFGFTTLTLRQNFAIGILYTGISIARGYLLRRAFNRIRFGNQP